MNPYPALTLHTLKRSEHFLLASVVGTDRIALFMELADDWKMKNTQETVAAAVQGKQGADCEARLKDHYTACLLDGAIGDALGAALQPACPRHDVPECAARLPRIS